jgi:signal transduction histidine kinase/CheY-like chemotaxis protein
MRTLIGESVPGVGSPSAARMQVEQLRLTCRQAARFPLPVFVVDAFLAWLVWREGMAGIAVAWFAVRLLLQAATTWLVRALQRKLVAGTAAPAAWAHEQGVLVLLFGLMGVSRAVLVPLLFAAEPGESQYIFTMVCMGLAAAGVGNVGGQVRVYMAFALPLGAALSLGWLLQGGEVPIMVGLLTLAAVAFLVSFVREQARSMQQIFALLEERERLAVGLQQQHQLAQEALAAKSRFIASASHDLRQPVTTIGLLVGLMSDAAPQAHSRDLLERVAQAVGALEHLLRGLLDLSRLDSGTVTPAMGPTALQALYTRLEAHAGPTARAKGLRLRWRGGALCVRSDPVLLQQMLQNLIDNALRCTEGGGILVSARRRGPATVRLEVRDTGCGIAAEHQHRVFEEFVQLGSTSRDGRHGLGLGLGLAIVKRNAELLGHRLTLISHAGRGSCFAIELAPDAGVPAPAGGAPDPASEASRSAQGSLLGMVLWLLEDDASVRVALTARLSSWGADVVPFGLLAELHAALRRAGPVPHGLLTDHRLPDGSGLEAIDAVRSRHGLVPALILTGDTGTDELMRFKTRGAPVVHKPFDQHELLARVAAWKQPA